MTECNFCKIAAGKIPAKIIYEDPEVLAFEDITPQAPVHVVIISRAHIPTFMDMKGSSPLSESIFLAARKVAEQKDLVGRGFRLVNNYLADGGQAVFHLHFHLLGGRRMKWPPG